MNELSQYGLFGIVVGGLVTWVLIMRKDDKERESRHKEERDEWRKMIEKKSDEQNDLSRKTIDIMSGLKTLLENRR